MAIVIDTETTGLLRPRLSANELQPQVIEVYMAKFDEETFEIIDEFDTFVKPVTSWGEQILLEDPVNDLRHICRITGIYDDMLYNAPTFAEIAEEAYDFCEDEDLLLGQNIMFDSEVMRHNFIRVNRPELFVDFRKKVCTVEMSYPIKKKRSKLGDLYQMATGTVLEDAHRAKHDAKATLVVYKWLLEQGF